MANSGIANDVPKKIGEEFSVRFPCDTEMTQCKGYTDQGRAPGTSRVQHKGAHACSCQLIICMHAPHILTRPASEVGCVTGICNCNSGRALNMMCLPKHT
eukprot:350897-Chlamydomonas_euryale.AAC.5